MKELNFGFFALTLVTLFAVVNTSSPAAPFNKFFQCPKNDSEPIYPIKVMMSPYLPIPVGNVFTVSGNFHLESSFFDIVFENPDIYEKIANKCRNVTGCSSCEVVDGCSSENNSFKSVMKFDLMFPAYFPDHTVSMFAFFNNDQMLGCVHAIIVKHPHSERGM
ncbi:hypothetical protein C2G38_2229651 [Gigaspora rosea]|uniref:MD-2-related lipid-recognition domain-containing protein n=1 Tax=Gigaspora rosea TaxID=44941 RepID=A0A397U2Y5_9GLOM|nr:hypothetical protein C2G38_2229651 [Gigaspora rosea]